MVLLFLHQHFDHVSTYRLMNIRPPAPTIGYPIKPDPPAPIGFRFNRYKKIETNAFRPTNPGPSPGMGHDTPPGRSNHKH
ncbi:hypothetical protein PHJA_000082700 [Phtheirospermum japonicum]|uniref:Uncharacterized protein n=1 Tax=Phtheirospermum japonicum TaxID=374723 RepID=A0A830B1Q7_9LAMI|nr:hypothetical protein PHJA_000082700 [Phtheirospermum japonicum]